MRTILESRQASAEFNVLTFLDFQIPSWFLSQKFAHKQEDHEWKKDVHDDYKGGNEGLKAPRQRQRLEAP